DVRRFRHEWEREASLKLRDGRRSAAETYARHGRVTGGHRETILDQLYKAWRADMKAGRRSLMVAADAQTVTDLNTRARNDRIAAGEVAADGVTLADGTNAGVGDLVVTRLNQRDIVADTASVASAAWVKNGDQWLVTRVGDEGSVVVRRPIGGATATLPAQYVAEHVELGYATTAHRAQGRTVDTAHAYVSPTTMREPLYVMATRGRETNMLYVDSTYEPDPATAHHDPDSVEAVEPLEVLHTVLARSGADVSAHEQRDKGATTASNPARLFAEGEAILEARRRDQQSGRPLQWAAQLSLSRPHLEP
ncbi:TrwC relaxase, partial [Intrasporangium chromatireducens Q5-1]